MNQSNPSHSLKDRTAPRRTESDRRETVDPRGLVGERRQSYFRVEMERRTNEDRRSAADRREQDRRSGRDPRDNRV